MSVFVFDTLTLNVGGWSSPPPPPPHPHTLPAHLHPLLRLIFPVADETMNRCYRRFAHVNVNVIAFCRAFVSVALQSAHFMGISIRKQPQLSIQRSYRAQTADASAHRWTMRRPRSEREDKILTDPLLTGAGISSLSCNITRRGECDCWNTREKRGSRRKSGERTMQKKKL